MLKSKSKPQKMRDQAGGVMDRLTPHVENAREMAAPVIADAKVKAADARLKAAPYVAEARERTSPYVNDARDRATPVVEGVRTKFNTEVIPVITAALAAASEASEEARTEAKKRGSATAAALKGEVEPPKRSSHKLRNLLLLLGLGSIVAFVAKQMSDREASTAWQSSYTPTPPASGTAATGAAPTPAAPTATGPGLDDTPMGTAAATSTQTHDEGAAAPDEAAADAAETPHRATTPEDPAEEIAVDTGGEHRG
jgi:vacuolar-type H+-ATPase subunit H